MTPHSSGRTTSAVALVLAVTLGLTACGGGPKPKTTDGPTETTAVSETPIPTPTATPNAEPLSAFEGRPAVKALRAWAVAEAKAVNARERSLVSLRALTTARGLGLTRSFAADDLTHHYLLPGPHPFTPVAVRTHGALAKVSTCFLLRGWSVDRKTQKRVRKREVVAAMFEMRKVSGTWKFDQYYAGTADCAGVRVRRVRW